jgi:nucleotide-binding universal stress UspA family protein
MTGPATAGPRVLVGFDGSPAAIAALGVAADLVPGADATVLHLWTPPFAGDVLRRRLVERARTVDELMELVEQEGAAEAERVARLGCVVARAEGWTATARVARSYGGDGLRFAAVAQESGADLVLVGARGLSGVSAVLDSTTDLVVQHSPVPVLVVPFPMLVDERERARTGPVVVGWDGSPVPLDGDGRGVTLRRVPAPHPVPGPARATARALAEAARREAASVVVVGSRGRSTWRTELLGSTALAVLRRTHVPVLVVPAAARVTRGAEPVGSGAETG